jgi:hypothetical protein
MRIYHRKMRRGAIVPRMVKARIAYILKKTAMCGEAHSRLPLRPERQDDYPDQ